MGIQRDKDMRDARQQRTWSLADIYEEPASETELKVAMMMMTTHLVKFLMNSTTFYSCTESL